MKNFLLLMLAVFLGLLGGTQPVAGQGGEQTVTGTVRDATTGETLEGATIRVNGTKTMTKSEANGSFTVKASVGQKITISIIGYETATITVGQGGIGVVNLKPISSELEEVVVAMDQKRKPRELGFSNQRITGTEVAETQRENFINALQGRIAGATITPTNGMAGASSSIVLRGFNSLALSNQPLFVVDGIIMDNESINESGGSGSVGLASDRPNRNNDYTNRMADINPNDIESITVLKGPEATALYGSLASSGAIIITTKKAKPTGKIRVNYDNSFRLQELTRVPKFSNLWQSGTNGVAENSFSYFGPPRLATEPVYDNIGNFFKTGFAQTHNLSAEYGRKNMSWRFSGSYFDQDGVVPNNKYQRTNLRISNTTKIGKYVEVSPAVSYIRSTHLRPRRSTGGYLLNLMVWPTNNDVRKYQNEDGSKIGVFAADPQGETDNPLWNAYNNESRDETDRYLYTLGVNIKPTKWLSVNGRFGYDTYKTTGWSFYHPQSFVVAANLRGEQDNYWRNYKGYNHTITATATHKYKKFNGRLMAGTMWQDYKTEMFAVVGNQIIDVKRRDSANTAPSTRRFLNRNLLGKYNERVTRQIAFFTEASINYDQKIYFTYSHRFEQSSTLPPKSRAFNYPGMSLSFIMSDILPFMRNSKAINFWKLRTSLASTARLNSPYSNQSVFNNVLSSGLGYAYGFTNNNPDLVPEIQNTYEVGTEMRLFNDKFTIDLTYYNTKCDKQIVENFRSSYGTGFVLNTLNTATTRNEGVEIVLGVTPVKNKNFSWNILFNANRMWNKVLFLPGNVPEFYISDTWLFGNARGGLIKGGPTTSITAIGYARNLNGDILINPITGIPLADNVFKVYGDRNPNFTVGMTNNIRYKNWGLNFLWDYRNGGDIFNATEMFLYQRGRSKLQDDRLTPRVVKGVLNDGLQNTANPTPNTIAVLPYYQQDFYTSVTPESFIEKDINWLRLRDLTLNYTFSNKALGNVKWIKNLGAFVTVNDLILITNYRGADPAVNGNTASTRGVGAAGFDFGNIAMPISWNFGIRAAF